MGFIPIREDPEYTKLSEVEKAPYLLGRLVACGSELAKLAVSGHYEAVSLAVRYEDLLEELKHLGGDWEGAAEEETW